MSWVLSSYGKKNKREKKKEKKELKHSRPVSSKDKNLQLRKEANKSGGQIEIIRTRKNSSNIINNSVPKETGVLEIVKNKEISINYVMDGIWGNQNKVNVDNAFAYKIVLNVVNDIEDQEPKFISDCQQRNDWPKMERCYWSRIRLAC